MLSGEVREHAGRLNDSLFFSRAHEKIADPLALRAVFIAVISGRLTVWTIFPIATVAGTCVSAVAAFSGDSSTTTTFCHFTVVTRATAMGAMRNGEVSLQHVQYSALVPHIELVGFVLTARILNSQDGGEHLSLCAKLHNAGCCCCYCAAGCELIDGQNQPGAIDVAP